MKILIVGGNSSLAQVLRPVLESFADVLTAGRSSCDIDMDLTWPVGKFILPCGLDVVINTAAHFGGQDFDDIFQAESVNVLGSLNLCEAASKAGAKHFVSISSTSAYLDSTSEYYGSYAITKKQSDEIVQLYCAKVGLLYTILRPSQLYGELNTFRKHQPFLYHAIDRVKKNEDIIIYGSRNPLRNYLHAGDFCEIISRIVKNRVQGLYACTSPVDIGLLEVANTVIKVAGTSSKVVFNKEMKDIPDNIFNFNDSLYRLIDYFPTITIVEGIIRLMKTKFC